MKTLKALLVEDSEEDAALLLLRMRQGGYKVHCERLDTAEAMRRALERENWDVVISDYVMPQFSGLAALQVLKETGIDLPFIIVSGHIGEDTAVAAMKAGAHDYLMKDNLARLLPAVERELALGTLARESARLRDAREALRRLDNGVFGICLDCEEDISLKRLAAVPWAARCIVCQERADREYLADDNTLESVLGEAAA
jgi:DNA-binding NtrC family response regulator